MSRVSRQAEEHDFPLRTWYLSDVWGQDVRVSNLQVSSVQEGYIEELTRISQSLVSWREFGCRDDANAWRKSTKEADKHKIFLLQFRK